ncbi:MULTISPECIES: hypothetical protein [unclassified Kribbella]|nr:hypothetical protein OG817_21470 [Kribbella sp. NBC_00889]
MIRTGCWGEAAIRSSTGSPSVTAPMTVEYFGRPSVPWTKKNRR